METINVRTDPEYSVLLPPLSKEEYEALKESIRKEGQHLPIIVNEKGVILDGHHRFQVCKELGLQPKIEVRKFNSKIEEKLFVIDINLQRRQLNDAQRVWLNLERYKIEREKAKQRQGMRTDLTSGSIDPKVNFGRTRDIIAEYAGVPSGTVQRALTVFQFGEPHIIKSTLQGKTSIYYAYKMTKRKIESKEYPPLPEGRFNVIYADPPWRYNLPFAGSPDMHYPTLETEKICRLEIPVADDAVLFLWATNPCLKDAFSVMSAWGFKYKTNMVWVKDRAGTGYWVRGQHELLLIGIKGKMETPLEQNRPPSVIFAPRTNHSEKPKEVYEIIERMFPNGKYLELFARQKRERWCSWGLEIES